MSEGIEKIIKQYVILKLVQTWKWRNHFGLIRIICSSHIGGSCFLGYTSLFFGIWQKIKKGSVSSYAWCIWHTETKFSSGYCQHTLSDYFSQKQESVSLPRGNELNTWLLNDNDEINISNLHPQKKKEDWQTRQLGKWHY